MPLKNFSWFSDHEVEKVGNLRSWEIAFLVCLGIMNVLDLYAIWLYKRGINEGFYLRHPRNNLQPNYTPPLDQNTRGSAPPAQYNTFDATPVQWNFPITPSVQDDSFNTQPLQYDTQDAPPPYYKQQQPQTPQRATQTRDVPMNIQVEGLDRASLVLSDYEGGIIFLTSTKNPASERLSGNPIDQAQAVWISREAILRNPFYPEVHVLTAIEISQIDFGNDRENVRQALRY